MAWLQPGFLLRAESAVFTAGLLLLYSRVGGSWGLFFAAILVPDLSFIAYRAGSRVGAAVYNLVHTNVPPLVLLGYGLIGNHALPAHLGVIWLTHISIDRLLGFGLKYPTAFQDTHLARV